MIRKMALISICLMATFGSGCKKKMPHEYKSMQEAAFNMVLRDPKTPDLSKRLAEIALKERLNDQISCIPTLIYAGCILTPKGKMFLTLTVSDKDQNMKGIIIHESYNGDCTQNCIVHENYTVFPRANFTGDGFLKFCVVPRNEKGKKDGKTWEDYIVNYKSGDSDHHPTIYLSIPDRPKTEVYISVYDADGHVSNSLPLDLRRD